MTLAVLALYFVLVLAVGASAQRFFRGTGEDYFVATRSIGPFVLLMSLFGTHMTSFSLLGASGEAYHRGIGVFALMASSSAVVVPAVFLFVGVPLWRLGKRQGYRTQVQYFRDRWGSDAFGVALFLALTALLVPYIMIGIKGGGVTLAEISRGDVPEWAGSLVMCLVVVGYVGLGGMRGTAWVNTLQTLVLLFFGTVTFTLIVIRSGGLRAALDAVATAHPELLQIGGRITALELVSYLVIPLSVGMFPHIFVHWLTAKREGAFRPTILFYPLCLAVVWLPSVLVGVLGSVQVPGLVGPASNSVLLRMIDLHAGDLMAGFLAAGVLAAVMNAMDSQILALSSLLTTDLIRRPLSDRQQVWLGRLFVLALLAVTYGLSLAANRSLFKLGVWSFSGFVALFPLVVAALYWKRSTVVGAWSALLVSTGLWLWFFVEGGKNPTYSVGGTGLLPAVVLLGASTLALVVGSLLSKPPEAVRLARFFPPEGGP